MNVLERLNNFLESLKWKVFFSSLNLLDFFLLAFVVLGVFFGFRKGLVRMIVLNLEFMLVMWLVLGNYPSFANALEAHFYVIPKPYHLVTSFFFILPVIWAAVMIIDGILRSTVGSWVKTETTVFLKWLGGGILGFFYFLMVFSMVFKGVLFYPSDSIKQLRHAPSITFSLVHTLPDKIYRSMNDWIAQLISRR